MSRQTFTGVDGPDAPPSSFTAVASTTSETNLWTPALWTPIPAYDMKPGKVYHLRGGGTYTTTSTPTIIFTPRFGTSATPGSNTSLGASNTITLNTIGSAKNWHMDFYLVVRSLGLAASGATIVGNGAMYLDNGVSTAAGIVIPMGGTVVTTADHTTAQGLIVSATWGTSNASNSIQCTWTLLNSEN